jgi:hypothetical protein
MRDEKEREADRIAEERLELMPRIVRVKLDRVGIKVHLAEWRVLAMSARQRLRDLPCETSDEIAQYAGAVEQLVREATGKAPDRLQKEQG